MTDFRRGGVPPPAHLRRLTTSPRTRRGGCVVRATADTEAARLTQHGVPSRGSKHRHDAGHLFRAFETPTGVRGSSAGSAAGVPGVASMGSGSTGVAGVTRGSHSSQQGQVPVPVAEQGHRGRQQDPSPSMPGMIDASRQRRSAYVVYTTTEPISTTEVSMSSIGEAMVLAHFIVSTTSASAAFYTDELGGRGGFSGPGGLTCVRLSNTWTSSTSRGPTTTSGGHTGNATRSQPGQQLPRFRVKDIDAVLRRMERAGALNPDAAEQHE